MYVISKDFAFSASHQLHDLRDGHPCARMHGHNYVVRVELTAAALDDRGFVLDYGDLAPFGDWIDQHLDHRHLNDVMEGGQPSAEHLAAHLYNVLMAVLALQYRGVKAAVGVSETPKTWAWFRP